MQLKIPVLAYHAANVFGNKYENNDNVALKSDLETIKQAGVEIISTHKLVEYILGKIFLNTSKKYIVITFDDGNNLDFIDSYYPEYGMQPSFYSLLQESDQNTHATSFVIASPEARKVMEKTCLKGHPLLQHVWWEKAEETGLISIENHSWDHVHPTLENVQQADNDKGDFTKITNKDDANSQIQSCSSFINSVIKEKKVSLFAYPFGHFNDYLVNEYFPHEQTEIKAAFTCEPSYTTKNTNIWKVPRFVCGWHWKTQEQLTQIIKGEFSYDPES